MSYPEGFPEWPLDRRNEYFAAEAGKYDDSLKRRVNGHATADRNPEPPRPLTRELPPADPFPVEALGKTLAGAAHAIHDRVQAPIAICGQSVLAAAALSVQAHADVDLPTGQRRPLSLFMLTIAASGERKSACDAEAMWPVWKREAALRTQHQDDSLTYANARDAYEEARTRSLKANKGAYPETLKASLDKLGPPRSRRCCP